MVKIDEEIEVHDPAHRPREGEDRPGPEAEAPSPWENVDDKYPVGTVHKGEVVNVMSYGAFVKLEDGHRGPGPHQRDVAGPSASTIRASWCTSATRSRCVVLNINKEKQEISLGMKQTQANPWDKVADTYPPGTHGQRHGPQPHQLRRVHRDRGRHRRPAARQRHVAGPARSATRAKWSRRARRSSARCCRVDQERRRIALGLKQLDDDPWATDIPNRYQPGQLVKGKVTKITNFGVFVELEDGLEGLLHISELADHKVENPEDVVKVGDEIEVKILRVDTDERKIGLSRKRVEWAEEDAAAASERLGGAPAARAGRRAQGRRRLRRSGPLFKARLEPSEDDRQNRQIGASRRSQSAASTIREPI